MSKKKKTPAKKAEPTRALALAPQYVETHKYNQWVKHFLNIKDKETWGNATKAALRAYNTTDYNTAGVIGHDNLRKLKSMSVLLADQQGFGFADMMKIGLSKMMQGDFNDWEKMMIRLGYFETEKKIGVQVNTNTQNNYDIKDEITRAREERGLEP